LCADQNCGGQIPSPFLYVATLIFKDLHSVKKFDV